MMDKNQLSAEMEAFIRNAFEQNYEELRLDSGHAIAPDVKLTALNQVLLYWRMLNEIARNVTDTEVRLSLPNQKTPDGRTFAIEGVVDILRDNERTIMYDIKTHNADYVRENLDVYEQQLNVYAHIWQNLRGQQLDETAIIATDYPENVRDALASENASEIEHALSSWDPVVPIRFDPKKVLETIAKFGETVDDIENGVFAPPPMERLNELVTGAKYKVRFATHVCRNCDARFSCKSYREYAWRGGRKTGDEVMAKYFAEALPDEEMEAWRSSNLEVQPNPNDLRSDFTSR
ncbi:MAG: hypothetical protein JETCAE01_33740 [Anaerolineaceae bacterium]|nr:MAG: hypothetical protein JETCAE01_33740 [Anaerolineaceae bacterium]